MFLHEDTSKPENRINLAIFGLMSVKSFREWIQSRLGLPPTTVLYPAENLPDGAGRPDFALKNADTDEIIGWVEVECYKDEEQLARFRKSCGEVKAIWGKREYGADLSLEEIAEHLSGLEYSTEPQVRYNAEHLRLQIEEVLSGRWSIVSKPAPVSERIRETSFVQALDAALDGRMSFDILGRMRAGEIRANTRGENGFSLRVYSREAGGDKSLSVLNRTAGRPDIYFQSQAKMLRYLPRRPETVQRLANLVSSMGGDMVSIGLNARTSVRLEVVESRISELADIVVELSE